MAQFIVNPGRSDPYKNLKFRVKWDGRYVAGVSKVSALQRTTDAIDYREGSDPSALRKLPGLTEYEPITLERGVTQDTEFEKWARKLSNYGDRPGAEISQKDFRKDIIIDLFDDAGQKVLSYKVYHCWVSEYQALPDLDANGDVVAIEKITLQNEGWEREHDLTETEEPSFTEAE
jgi:phage tail-like protein